MVGQLQWSPSGDGYQLLLDTGMEPMEVTISLAYEGGRISYLEQDVVVPDGQVNDIGLECPDELRVDVVMGVSTQGGELAESWGTVLVIRTDASTGEPLDPEARVDVNFADIVGTFAISGIEPTTWSVSEAMRVLVEFADGGSSGRIQTAVTDPDGRSRTAEIGAWQATAS